MTAVGKIPCDFKKSSEEIFVKYLENNSEFPQLKALKDSNYIKNLPAFKIKPSSQ